MGAFRFFEMRLKDIAAYGPLRSEMFQKLREVGNALAFVWMLEQGRDLQDDLMFPMTSHVFGIQPLPAQPEYVDTAGSLLKCVPVQC